MAKKKRQSPVAAILAHRGRFPKVKDAAFSDAISVYEACEIMGVTTSYIYRLIREGQLAGKVLTRTTYIVSRKAAMKNAAEHAAGKPGRGRPRAGTA